VRRTSIIKLSLAGLLLLSFFLPFVRGCSGIKIPRKQDSARPDAPDHLVIMEVKDPKTRYAHDFVRSDATSILEALGFMLFGFLWPLPLLLLRRVTRRRALVYALGVIELALCVVSFWLLSIIVMFEGTLLIGGYLAFGSLIAYFFTTAAGLGIEIRSQVRARAG